MPAKPYEKQTLFWLLMTHLMQEPLFVMYGFISLILRKHFAMSAWVVALFLSIKPVLSIFSFYWSSYLTVRPHALRKNFFVAKVLARLLFLLLPCFPYPGFLLLCSVSYMLFYQAAKPAWMEILRSNAQESNTRTAFGWALTLSYVAGMVLAVFCGAILDAFSECWSYLFFGSALLGLVNVYFLTNLPIKAQYPNVKSLRWCWQEQLLRPWLFTKQLMQSRKDFAKFQWGYMLCGAGLMSIQPALQLLMADVLQVSYLSFGLAYTSWKGICIALSSPIWSYLLERFSLFSLSYWVFFLAGLLPFFLLFSPQDLRFLYLAYIFYGLAQGGSQLIWNLSGPHFSQTENSAPYTAVNVMMVGIRGIFAPFLGAAITHFTGPFPTLAFGAFLCALGAVYIFPRKQETQSTYRDHSSNPLENE
ncbi:MAG: MFS transporter [Chlamydiota bacterium]